MKLTDCWDFLMEGGYDLIFNNEETCEKQFKRGLGVKRAWGQTFIIQSAYTKRKGKLTKDYYCN